MRKIVAMSRDMHRTWHDPVLGVPAVLEQKTTICCKLLYLLTSKRRASPTYSRERTHVEGMEENPFYGLNSTLSVGNIRGLLPRYAWTKTFVFFLTIDRESMDRCLLYACYGNPVHGFRAGERQLSWGLKDAIWDRLREPNWRFTLCTARSMPSNNAKRLLSCCFAVTEHL